MEVYQNMKFSYKQTSEEGWNYRSEKAWFYLLDQVSVPYLSLSLVWPGGCRRSSPSTWDSWLVYTVFSLLPAWRGPCTHSSPSRWGSPRDHRVSVWRSGCPGRGSSHGPSCDDVCRRWGTRSWAGAPPSVRRPRPVGDPPNHLPPCPSWSTWCQKRFGYVRNRWRFIVTSRKLPSVWPYWFMMKVQILPAHYVITRQHIISMFFMLNPIRIQFRLLMGKGSNSVSVIHA